MRKRRNVGFSFEGVGFDTAFSSGAFFHYGKWDVVGTFEGVESLKNPPDSVSTATNPFTGEWTTSTFTITLDASDRIAQAFLSSQRRSDLQLLNAIDDLATTVDIVDTLGTAITGLTGVLYVDDETLLITADNGGGNYDVTRGFWSSEAASHEAGIFVYERIPYWSARVVRLYDYDEETALFQQRWIGLVEDIKQVGPNVVITTSEVLRTFQTAEVNTGVVNLAPQLNIGGRVTLPTRTLSGLGLGNVFYTPNVIQNISAARDLSAFQYGDAVVRGNYLDEGDVVVLLKSDPLLGSTVELDDNGAVVEQDRCYELLVVDGNTFTSFAGDNPTGVLPTGNGRHPIEIALALITSTGTGTNGAYDVLTAQWGLGVDYIDLTSWEDAITEAPDLVIDQLILGWNGEPVNVFEVVQEYLLRPFGFFLTVNISGNLALARLRLPEVGDLAGFSDISPYPQSDLTVQYAFADTPQEIVADVGRLPFSDGTPITIREVNTSQRRARLTDVNEHAYDLRVLKPETIGVVNGVPNAEATVLLSVLSLGLDQSPKLKVTVADYLVTGATPYELGSYVQLTDLGGLQNAWIVDKDGARVLDVNNAAFAGMITERRWDTTRHTYDLTLLLLNYHIGKYVRWRAPAMVLGATTTDTEMIANTTDYPEYGASPANAFTVGDDVDLCTRDGVPLGEVREVVSIIDPETVEIDSAFSLGTAVDDYVLRLATSDQYTNNNVTPPLDRAYAYFADGTTLPPSMTVADNDDPDTYGTRVLAGVGEESGPDDVNFTGIDDDAVTINAGAAQPLDSWVEYTWRDNESWLIQYGSPTISWVPLSANADDLDDGSSIRPYASVDESTILYIPWIAERGLKSISAGINGRVATENAAPGDKAQTIKIRIGLFDDDTATDVDNTEALTPQFNEVIVEHVLSAQPEQTSITNLRLTVQSDFTNTTPAGVPIRTFSQDFSMITSGLSSSANYFALSSGAGRPSSTSGDTECILFYGDYINTGGKGAGDRQAVDWFAAPDVTVTVGVGTTTYTAESPIVRSISTSQEAARADINYIQVRGVHIEQVYEDTTYLVDTALRPQKPVLGEVEALHPIRTEEAYRRARPLWIGPQGDKPGGVLWPDDYTQRFIRFDRTNVGAVLDTVVFIDTDAPDVIVLLNVLPFHLALTPTSTFTTSFDNGAIAGWDFWVEAEELDTGGATNTIIDTSATPLNEQIQHYGTVANMKEAPALYQELLIQQTSDPAPLREGQLFREDYRFIRLVALRVPITGAFTDQANPIRLRVFAESDGSLVTWQNNNSDTHSDSNLRMTIVGASVWEDPK